MQSFFQLPSWLRTRTRRLAESDVDGIDDRSRSLREAGQPAGLSVADNIARPVIDLVRPHLASADCLIVTGYQDFLSSLSVILRELPELMEPTSARRRYRLRIAFGVDTANTVRLGRQDRPIGEDLRRHFLARHGLLVEGDGDLQAVMAKGAIERGEIDLRVFDAARAREILGISGDRRLHAKVVTSPLGGLAGSANFSRAGLYFNIEYDDDLRVASADAGVRAGAKERQAFAERIWEASADWNAQALEILQGLLRPASAEDALARTIAEQKGFRPWRVDLLEDPSAVTLHPPLPYQADLTYEAASIVYEHGFAFVSAPAGSGKTHVGMHLGYVLSETFSGVVAGDDTGGMSRGGAVVIAPPKVLDNWSTGSRHLVAIPNTKIAVRGRAGEDRPDRYRRMMEEASVILLDESHTVTPAFVNPSTRSQAVEFAPPAWSVCLSATLLGNNDVDWLTHLQEKRASIFMSPAYNSEMRAIFESERIRGSDPESPDLFGAAVNPLDQDEAGLSPETREKLSQMLSPFLAHRQRSCIGERGPEVSGGFGRYPRIAYHGRPSDLALTGRQAAAVAEVARLAGELSPGKRLVSRERTRFGTRGEFRHNQVSLQARNLVNILRSSSELALWQMEHGAIGRNLRRFEIEDRASRSGRPEQAQLMLFEEMMAPDPPSTPRCDELVRLLRQRAIRSLDARRIRAVRAIQKRHDRIVFLAERVNVLQLFAERLARAGCEHDIYVVSGSAARKGSDDMEETDILRQLLDVSSPSYKVIEKGKHVEGFFRAGSGSRAEGKVSVFMTYQMAEGINLQSCDTLVGLGLTSNVTNLIQGLGRVDRIDSPFEQIHYYLVDIPTPAVASDEKAAQRLEKFRALAARERVARAANVSRDTEEIFRDTVEFLREQRVLRETNFHDLLSTLRGVIDPDRYAEIADLDIVGLWGAELAVLPASRQMTILHLKGHAGAGLAARGRMMPPRLLMIDEDGRLDSNQIACAGALRQGYEETVKLGLHRAVPRIEDLSAAIERLGRHVNLLKEWDLRPERTVSLLDSLSVFLAPALGVDPGTPDLDQRLFGDLSLDALEVLCETWARLLDPWWIKAKREVRESLEQDRAAGYISLDEIVFELERDASTARNLREKMCHTYESLSATAPSSSADVAARISTVFVAP